MYILEEEYDINLAEVTEDHILKMVIKGYMSNELATEHINATSNADSGLTHLEGH